MNKSGEKPDWLDEVRLDPTLKKNTQCKGVALILSNNYEGSEKSLPGTDEDSKNMNNFFLTLGNYDVVLPKKNLKRDLKSSEFKDVCEYLASLEYPDVYKRIVVYFAGHGDDGCIAMQDKDMHIEEIQAIFDPTKHPKLYNMARIFLIDACRGSMYYSNHGRRRSDDSATRTIYQAHCKYDNELIAYSTLKGYVAYDKGSHVGGSWTHALYTCLIRERHEDLNHVLTIANKMLGSSQTSPYQSSLKDFIYFWKEAGMWRLYALKVCIRTTNGLKVYLIIASCELEKGQNFKNPSEVFFSVRS